MNLYIKLDDSGTPIGNPITEYNLKIAFPGINLPNNNYAKFQRNLLPRHTVYERYEDTTYEFIDGIVHDVHKVTKLTKSEIKQLQTEVKDAWKNNPKAFKSWKFNTALCKYLPPIEYPVDGNHYVWDENVVNWVIFDPSIHLENETAVDETIDPTVVPDETAVDETIDPTVVPDELVAIDTPAAE
jgi:hypothetical protein